MKRYIKIMKSLIEEYDFDLQMALETHDLREYYSYDKIYNYNSKEELEEANYTRRLRLATAMLYSTEFEDEEIEELADIFFLYEFKNKKEITFTKGDVLDILDSIRAKYKEIDDLKFFNRVKKLDSNCKINCIKKSNIKGIENLLIEECIEITINLKEYDTASKLIDEWIKEQKEWNVDNLGKLYYFERDRKNYKGQLLAEEKIINIVKKSSDNDEISERLNKYAKDLISFKYYNKAEKTLKEIMPYLEKTDVTWYETILGQAVLENYIDLILENPENKKRKKLWNEIKPYLEKTKNYMPIVLKRKIEKAKESIA